MYCDIPSVMLDYKGKENKTSTQQSRMDDTIIPTIDFLLMVFLCFFDGADFTHKVQFVDIHGSACYIRKKITLMCAKFLSFLIIKTWNEPYLLVLPSQSWCWAWSACPRDPPLPPHQFSRRDKQTKMNIVHVTATFKKILSSYTYTYN